MDNQIADLSEIRVFAIRGRGKYYVMKLRGYLLEGIPVRISRRQMRYAQVFLKVIPVVRKCFDNAAPRKASRIKVWGIHEISEVPLPGDIVIFANYSTDIERHNYSFWNVRFMGIVRYTNVCPNLAEILFGTDYWKTMMLLSEVKRTSPIVRNAILDFLRVYIKPEPVNRWRLSDPIPFEKFSEYITKYGKTQQDKKQLSEFFNHVVHQIQGSLKYRNDSWLRVLIWRNPVI